MRQGEKYEDEEDGGGLHRTETTKKISRHVFHYIVICVRASMMSLKPQKKAAAQNENADVLPFEIKMYHSVLLRLVKILLKSC